MEKRGAISVMEIVVWTIPILIAAAIVIYMVTGGLGKGGSFIDTLFGGFEDCDNDKVPNKEDSCPCQPQGTTPHETYAGCPSGVSPPGLLLGSDALVLDSSVKMKCTTKVCEKLAGQ